ncbi:exodeoxyribonuclease V subunit alpha [Thermithiobacillus plumbiphilus]|uniref:RecBCD enzyme subunit RecD n=1 Tax=Thermithiobacillus plumbiphilus TaxID=1729899 RepID=A0ABU9D5P3_9PROT
MPDQLYAAASRGLIRSLDLHFARTLERLADGRSEALSLGACLVSHQVGLGHVCVDLAQLAGRPLFGSESQADGEVILAPDLNSWRKHLQASGVVGQPGQGMPLILDEQDRLYLGRYWRFEDALARQLRARALMQPEIDLQRLRAGLERFFGPASAEPDWQKLAAAIALLRGLAVIAGGPGTGKTTTVVKILALLLEQDQNLRIALVAPTGKAAARLSESIKARKQDLACDAVIRQAVPEEAGTIHRLLKALPGQNGFRHHAGHPLPVDVLVLDEASMVDLPLMARLVDALPPQARLYMLGDQDQLASVEAGSVLADICGASAQRGYSPELCGQLQALAGVALPATESVAGPLQDCIVHLRASHRFRQDSGIGALAQAINQGDAEAAGRILRSNQFADLAWQGESGAASLDLVAQRAAGAYGLYLGLDAPGAALEAFNRFRVLCALRDGPYGVAGLNQAIESALAHKGLISPGNLHYAGRPVMVIRNDYTLRLYNGDIGILLPDPAANGAIRAFFAQPDGSVRAIHPNRLPEHDTAYAMTVHKSQGSEFDEVLLVLPEADAPVLTRELIYTGVTRARRHMILHGSASILSLAIRRRVSRASGLLDKLWQSGSASPS